MATNSNLLYVGSRTSFLRFHTLKYRRMKCGPNVCHKGHLSYPIFKSIENYKLMRSQLLSKVF